MKSEKGWNPEKKKIKKKRGERYEKRKVWGGKSMTKKKYDRKDISTANTAEMLPLTFA